MSRYRHFGPRAAQLESLRAQGWRVVAFKTAPVVVAFHHEHGKVAAKAWINKADKPAWYYLFQDEEKARAFVDGFIDRTVRSYADRIEREKNRAQKRAALKACDYWTVGDVLYNSWGYDQTNIDWYQVTEVKPRSIVIRAISKNYAQTGFLSGECQPRRNEFAGEPQLKHLDENGRISAEFGCFTKWDGKSQHESHYA